MDKQSWETGVARAAGISGILGVLLNVAAVVFLRGQPHAYKPGNLDLWRVELLAHPVEAVTSAWCFTVGLMLLVLFAAGLATVRLDQGSAPGRRVTGALLLGLGALLDGLGTPAVAVVAQHLTLEADASAARALLGFTLNLDATFNLLLGLGLSLLSSSVPGPRWLAVVALLGGVISLPIAAQAVSESAAALLLVSGPLWLTWVTAQSLRLLRPW